VIHRTPHFLLAAAFAAATASAQFNFGTHDLRLDVGAPGEWNDQDVLNPVVLDTEVFSGFPKTMYYCGHGGPFTPGPERWIVGAARSAGGAAWARYPVALLGQGPPGTWDDTGRIHFSIVEHPGAGPARFRMYYSCSDGPDTSPGTLTQIGLALSPDGLTFTKLGPMPVLPVGPPGAWDDAAVFACCVLPPFETGLPVWRMYYTGFSARPGVPGATAGIGVATSFDGAVWVKSPAPIADLSGGDLSGGYLYRPYVRLLEGKYRMWVTKVLSSGVASPIRSVHYYTSVDGLTGWSGPDQPHGVLRFCHEAFPQWDSAANELRLWFVEQGGGGIHPVYGVPYDHIRVAAAPIHRDHPDEPYFVTGTGWYRTGPLTFAVSDPPPPGGIGLLAVDLAFDSPTVSLPTPYGVLALQIPEIIQSTVLGAYGTGQFLIAAYNNPVFLGMVVNFQGAVYDPARPDDYLTNPARVPLIP